MADDPDERIIGAQVYLLHFLSRVDGIKSPKRFANNHYKSRYAALYPMNGLFMRRNNFNCYEDQVDFQESVVKR